MKARSFFVLAYDIACDKRRAKIARLMESLAERVQESVFEAWLTAEELEKLTKKAQRILNSQEDSLRIYVLCEACRPKGQVHGQGRPTPPPQTMVV